MSLGVLLSGCMVVGPEAIRSGRMAYNEAITETNNQQILMVMVHNRYEEADHLLTVASVTANVRVSGSAQIEAGFGDGDNYDGNLVPFSGGFVYEENPTISYTPVAGEAYLGQVMSPLPLPVMARITRSLPRPEFAYSMLISPVNGIHNPAFLYEGQRDDPRFERLVALMTVLTQRHCLHRVGREGNSEASDLLIGARGSCSPAAYELLALLELPEEGSGEARVQVPVTHSEEAAIPGGITVSTRSIWELVESLWTAAMAKILGVNANTPVLTVPVSR